MGLLIEEIIGGVIFFSLALDFISYFSSDCSSLSLVIAYLVIPEAALSDANVSGCLNLNLRGD